MNRPLALSIIIPALNESATLGRTLDCLQPLQSQGVQVIVVDGGSSDATVELARSRGFTVAISERGRARQMNVGARLATGRHLLFLHADTCLTPAICRCLLQNGLAGKSWGFFSVRLSGQGWQLRVIETLMNLRSGLSGIGTGDQAIFTERQTWVAVNGFADIPLMEDVELCKRLKRLIGRPCRISGRVETSSRRWRDNGLLRTVLLMWGLRLAYFVGVSPVKLAGYYRR